MGLDGVVRCKAIRLRKSANERWRGELVSQTVLWPECLVFVCALNSSSTRGVPPQQIWANCDNRLTLAPPVCLTYVGSDCLIPTIASNNHLLLILDFKSCFPWDFCPFDTEYLTKLQQLCFLPPWITAEILAFEGQMARAKLSEKKWKWSEW